MATVAGAGGSPSTGGSSSGAPSYPYTCNTCQVAFRNIDLQKNHMRGDWHRYNLKRRVASLPAISSEVFNEKVLQARAATTAEADKAGFERSCNVCQKTYYSENSFQNHVGSQKHKARQLALARSSSKGNERSFDEASSVISSTFSLGEPIPAKNANGVELDSEAEEEFSQVIEGLKNTKIQKRPSPVKRPSNPHLSAQGNREKDNGSPGATGEQKEPGSATPLGSKSDTSNPSLKSCLFCNYESPTPHLNATHMERIHGMFIPEKQYLVDLDGLLKALQQRVHELNECLYCGKVKSNAFAVQTHMRDKSHCKIPYSTEEEQLEIGEFYDFRSTYSDGPGSDDEGEGEGDNGDRQNGGAKLGAKRPTIITNEDGDEVMDDCWETDSSASSLDSADLTAVPAEQHYHQYARLNRHPHHSPHDPRAHHQKDGWHSHAHKHTHAAFYDEYELHLPGGKHVGHRQHNKYFRQNLRHYPSPGERAEHAQLAIGNGEAHEEGGSMDVDGLNRLARRNDNKQRSLITRSASGQGLQGVSKMKIREVQRAEHRGRALEGHHRERQNATTLMGRMNQQKHFHYSKLGG